MKTIKYFYATEDVDDTAANACFEKTKEAEESLLLECEEDGTVYIMYEITFKPIKKYKVGKTLIEIK